MDTININFFFNFYFDLILENNLQNQLFSKAFLDQLLSYIFAMYFLCSIMLLICNNIRVIWLNLHSILGSSTILVDLLFLF